MRSVWHEKRAASYADLHSSIHTFGAQCVVYHPPEDRDLKKNSDHGELAIYLCKALPRMGHKCLILKSGKVKVFRTVEVHETIFPFLIELQKSVANQLQLEAEELEEIEEQNTPI